MGMWHRRGKAASARLSAAPYSAHHMLYSEAVVSSVVSAVALVDVGRFRETVEYVQKAAKALYEAAREVFEKVKVTVQRLVELFVEAVERAPALMHEHRAYLFLMAAAAAGVIALTVALNIWGLVELEKLAHAAVGAPFFAGRTDTGGKAAERFKTLAERHERWRVDENVINEIINAPLNKERPCKTLLRLVEQANLPKPLVELGNALARKDEVVQDAAVVAALVLYKTLVKNAEAYKEWAEWYKWARGLVGREEFTVATSDIKRLREAHRRLEEAAEEVERELNAVLALYKSHSRDLYEKPRPHLEVDIKKAEELAEARSKELSKFGSVNMGTKAYAILLSIAKGGIYGHVAVSLASEGALADIVLSTPRTAYDKAKWAARGRGGAVNPSRVGATGWEDRVASVLLRFLIGYGEIDPRLSSGAGEADLKFRRVEKEGMKGFQVFRIYGGIETTVGELWMGKTTVYFKVSKEEPRRLVEEAKRHKPDLSGMDKAPQYVAWRATDVSTSGKRIAAATVHSWQLRWYLGLLGEEESLSGKANVTKGGINFVVTMYWPREREDEILRESKWLKSLLDRRVESWRQLVDAIDWSWVLKRVEELAGALKPWIGPEGASDAEREELAKRMLGELALLTHFAETRRGKNNDEWREERV